MMRFNKVVKKPYTELVGVKMADIEDGLVEIMKNNLSRMFISTIEERIKMILANEEEIRLTHETRSKLVLDVYKEGSFSFQIGYEGPYYDIANIDEFLDVYKKKYKKEET